MAVGRAPARWGAICSRVRHPMAPRRSMTCKFQNWPNPLVMFQTIAFTTALAVLFTLPAKPAATAGIAELLVEDHYSQDGYEVDLYVTKADDGILAETTVTDPTNGDSID